MSIVGTRPPLIGEVSEYELHHRARLAIKPGITGMWQVAEEAISPILRKSCDWTRSTSMSGMSGWILRS